MATFGIRALIAVSIMAAALSGCSREGTLVIENNASTEFAGVVEGTQVTLETGASYQTTVYIGRSLGMIGPDEITATVAGSAITTRPFNEEVTIKNGETTTFQVSSDVGAVSVTNMHLASINEISARPCGLGDFGSNLLGGKTIAPGATQTIQLDGGCWDLQFTYDRDAQIDIVEDAQLRVGQVIAIPWTPGYVIPPLPPPGASAR
jgi:hypothetical protein